jgi:hypothetical protein
MAAYLWKAGLRQVLPESLPGEQNSETMSALTGLALTRIRHWVYAQEY